MRHPRCVPSRYYWVIKGAQPTNIVISQCFRVRDRVWRSGAQRKKRTVHCLQIYRATKEYTNKNRRSLILFSSQAYVSKCFNIFGLKHIIMLRKFLQKINPEKKTRRTIATIFVFAHQFRSEHRLHSICCSHSGNSIKKEEKKLPLICDGLISYGILCASVHCTWRILLLFFSPVVLMGLGRVYFGFR